MTSPGPGSHDPLFTSGDVVGFRAFIPGPDGGPLLSLGRQHVWEAGVSEADAIPTASNTHGFYAFKELDQALREVEPLTSAAVFALTGHWGKMVEAETGLRSQFATIVAFIRPETVPGFDRSAARLIFETETKHALAAHYPDVPVVGLSDVPRIIREREMFVLPTVAASPLMQFYCVPAPDSNRDARLRWASETEAEPGDVALPAAASWPDSEAGHPLDQRLRRETFRADDGQRYALWTLAGRPASDVLAGMDLHHPHRMARHRLP